MYSLTQSSNRAQTELKPQPQQHLVEMLQQHNLTAQEIDVIKSMIVPSKVQIEERNTDLNRHYRKRISYEYEEGASTRGSFFSNLDANKIGAMIIVGMAALVFLRLFLLTH